MPTSSLDSVAVWLSSLPSPISTRPLDSATKIHPIPSRRQLKRKALVDNSRLVSPPSSAAEMLPSTPRKQPKKRKVNAGDGQPDTLDGISFDDETPRAPQQPERRSQHTQRSETSSSSYMSMSSSASAQKKLTALSVSSTGLDRRGLRRANKLPQPLLELLQAMELVAGGVGVVPRTVQTQLTSTSNVPGPDIFEHNYGSPDGHTSPSLEWVLNQCEEAEMCSEYKRDEHGWNCAVHYPILKAALKKDTGESLVQFHPCTTARIIKEYLPHRADAKVVDFCMNIHPDRESSAADAIRQIRNTMPEWSINQTDFQSLQDGPICVSIETKRSGASDDEANLQVGIWQCAQWRILTRLVTDRVAIERISAEIRQDSADGDGDTGRDLETSAAEVQRRLAALPFLPCIVVHGHDWFIAATSHTPGSGKTALWSSDFPFGSTSTPLGVWKVIAGLRWLARWSEQVYWPWFLEQVCGIRP